MFFPNIWRWKTALNTSLLIDTDNDVKYLHQKLKDFIYAVPNSSPKFSFPSYRLPFNLKVGFVDVFKNALITV